MFLLAAEMMNVSPLKCIIFEDSEVGLRAARAAGSHVVRVMGENAVNFNSMEENVCDLQIMDFTELV